ncbi:MFS transporter [Actinomadura rugatobispora]|uniref:MFS transporter n=1 Tax=Actinomadura rugatobispora TaxID=1994 RepID=A0ABW0ZLW5_9ACTN|nr:MFS transporter [Actinomadura rugatobispora]
MKKEELRVVAASSVGTAFEWYDFFLYGSLVPVIGSKFFGEYGEAAQTVFALLTFAVGFLVRPLGAVIFARLGDLVGRKAVFLLTLIIMGVSTVAVGLLPTSEEIGVLAPALLLICRIAQGLAVSGEFGAAVTYVSEYAPNDQRGFYVGWLTGTTALAFSLSLAAQLAVQAAVGVEAFDAWGWRIPFIISVIPLALSVWIRLKLHESPLFLKMKEEGTHSKAPLREAFRDRRHRRMIVVVFVMAATQSFIGYLSTVYVLTTMRTGFQLDSRTVSAVFMVVFLLGFFLCVFFSWLSDRIGRRKVMITGLVLAVVTVFPVFGGLTNAANPTLAAAQDDVAVTIRANPDDCSFQFNPAGTADYTSACDRAREVLQGNSVEFQREDTRGATEIVVDGETITAGPTLEKDLAAAIQKAGYPAEGAAIKVDSVTDFLSWPVLTVAGLLLLLVAYAQMAQGPAAVTMAEVFPTRIRATAMSLPYQVGVGLFGGFLPATMVAIGTEAGSLTTALWYPVIAMAIGSVILVFTLPETRGTDLSRVGEEEEPDAREGESAGTLT